MQTFDDFDAWATLIRGADLSMACDRIERPSWHLAVRHLGTVVVQVAGEGGGNLCYGANTDRGTTLFLPLSHAEEHVVNCERLDERSLLAIPPGGDFCIRVRHRSHEWCSIALPPGVAPPRVSSYVVRSSTEVMRHLRSLVRRITVSDALREAPGLAHATAAAELIAAARDCFAVPAATSAVRATLTGRPRINRGEIIRRAIKVLDAEHVGQPSVATLAANVGVTERTLGRAFQDTYQVSPMDYMKLRLLHAVRRSLRSAADNATVANVLVQHGIWDFGRFSSRYRRQFGETPSDTLGK